MPISSTLDPRPSTLDPRHDIAFPQAIIFQLDCPLDIMQRKQVRVLVFVAGGDELFQPELFKTIRKVMKKVADARVVAVAVNRLAPEVGFVMP